MQIRLAFCQQRYCMASSAVSFTHTLTHRKTPPSRPPAHSSHFSKLGMRSLAAPEALRLPLRPGTVVTLQGMAVEALNDAYAKIESILTVKQRRWAVGGVPSQRPQRRKQFKVTLCGGHLRCPNVAESLMKECVHFQTCFFCFDYAFLAARLFLCLWEH
jgi:hypothetical protein